MTALDSTTAVAAALRPLVHFTPESNWMNDPNGLLFHDGRYHLFFQHNPEGIDHGSISWGHASSTDLVRWRQHPVAIGFDEHEQIFSGSAVVDESNSSGLAVDGTAPIVAVYTSARADGRQAQALAYSLDGGETWQKYAGNPVLDRGSDNFRDPKVFRYSAPAGDYWVMVAVEAEQRQVLLYRSDDLRNWSYLSSYGPAGAVGGVWECPDLFPLRLDGDPAQMRWVMLISLNPGGVAGGSGTHYVVGRFDGARFTPEREWPPLPADDPSLGELDWLDGGRDCYAGVTFSGLPDDERVLMAWMSNWDYARTLPTSPWRGSMTVARRLSLVTVDGRAQLRAEPVLPRGEVVARREALVVRESVRVGSLPPAARVEFGLDGGGSGGEGAAGAGAGDLTLEFSDGSASATVRLDLAAGTMELDRTDAGGGVTGGGVPGGGFASVERMRLPREGAGHVTVIVDNGSLEVFAADGVRCLTDLVFLEGDRSLTLSSKRGAQIAWLEITDLAV
jgi:levanase/fructan beta-fructosidase/levanbiose-producing levanase